MNNEIREHIKVMLGADRLLKSVDSKYEERFYENNRWYKSGPVEVRPNIECVAVDLKRGIEAENFDLSYAEAEGLYKALDDMFREINGSE